MARSTCEYCGTEYESGMRQCPLCGTPDPDLVQEESGDVRLEPQAESRARPRLGRSGTPQHRGVKRGSGARAAPEENRADNIPRWILVLICVILSFAAIIAALYALYALDILRFGKGEKDGETPAVPTDEDLPAPAEETGDPAQSSESPAPGTTSGTLLCTGLRTEADSLSLGAAGATIELKYEVEPEGCTEVVKWISSDPAVCSVDATGTVTAYSEGTATLTAACGAQTATMKVVCSFDAEPGENGGEMELNEEDVTLSGLGDQFTLRLRGGKAVAWTSSDPAVCTVAGGVLTAEGPGTATVTASAEGRQYPCTVRCSFEEDDPPDDGDGEDGRKYELDHDDVTLGVGESFEISVVDGVSGGWSVTDTSVCTVDVNGNVKGVGRGEAKVYTVIGKQRLECIVRVH